MRDRVESRTDGNQWKRIKNNIYIKNRKKKDTKTKKKGGRTNKMGWLTSILRYPVLFGQDIKVYGCSSQYGEPLKKSWMSKFSHGQIMAYMVFYISSYFSSTEPSFMSNR